MTLRFDDATIHVGHDLDGVHYDFIGAYVADLAAQNPGEAERYRIENCHPNRDFFLGLGLDFGSFMSTYADAMSRDVLNNPDFTHAGSVEAVTRLDEALGERVANHIITDRSVGARRAGAIQTASWAGAVRFPYDTIAIDSDKTSRATHFFIEDHVGNYRDLRAAGTECYVIRRFWNADSPDVHPDHWVETVDEFTDRVIDRVNRA